MPDRRELQPLDYFAPAPREQAPPARAWVILVLVFVWIAGMFTGRVFGERFRNSNDFDLLLTLSNAVSFLAILALHSLYCHRMQRLYVIHVLVAWVLGLGSSLAGIALHAFG